MAAIGDGVGAELAIATAVDASGVPVVTLSGELDTANADQLAAAVASVTARKPARLVFDLAGLSFMDSAGIAVLISAAATVEELRLRNPSPIVRRVIEITGLAGVLLVEP